jgi:acyl-CoA synthetase (AMP-forming)/AMP-acid ligase II
MQGLMMDMPLLISSILQHAARHHGDTEIVSRRVEGDIHRYTYADCELRARKLADALTHLGAQPGDRVATLAWNGYRHVETYYAVGGMGGVVHTINPRLHPSRSPGSRITPATSTSPSTSRSCPSSRRSPRTARMSKAGLPWSMPIGIRPPTRSRT